MHRHTLLNESGIVQKQTLLLQKWHLGTGLRAVGNVQFKDCIWSTEFERAGHEDTQGQLAAHSQELQQGTQGVDRVHAGLERGQETHHHWHFEETIFGTVDCFNCQWPCQ